MNFLDLRNASDEERRLITEILSNSPPANIEFPFDLKSACKIDNDRLNGQNRSVGTDKNFDCDAKNVNNIDTKYGDSLPKVGSPNIAAPVVPIPTVELKPSAVHVNTIQPMAPISTSPHMATHHSDVSVPNTNSVVDSPLLNQSQIAAPFPHGAIKTNYNMQPPLVQQGLSNTSGPPQVPLQIVLQNSSSNQNQHHRSIHSSQHSHAAHPQPQPRIPYQSRKHYNNNIHANHNTSNSSNVHHHYQNHFQNNSISNSTNTISPNSQNTNDTSIRVRNVSTNDSASSNTSSASEQQQTMPHGYNGNLQPSLQLMQNAKMSSKSDQKNMYSQDGTNVQLSSMSGDLNSVMMDMASGQSYAMAASHVPTFGPQIAYGPHAIYPYFFSLPHFPVPTYMIPTNSVVPPQGQVPPQQSSSNQPPTSGMQQTRPHQPPQFHGTNHHHNRRQSPNGESSSAQSSTASSDSPRLLDKSANGNHESAESSRHSDASNIDDQNTSTQAEGSGHINPEMDQSHTHEEIRSEKRNAKMDSTIVKETYQESNSINDTKGLVNGFTSYSSQTRASYKNRLSGPHIRKASQENHQQSAEIKAEDSPIERPANASTNGRFSKQQSAKQSRYNSENQLRSANSWANKRSQPADHVQTSSSDNVYVKTDETTNTTKEVTVENQSVPESQEVPKRSSSATRDSQSSNHEQSSRPPPKAIQESSDIDIESQEDAEQSSTPVRSSNSKSLWTDLFKTKNADGSTSFAAENDRSISLRDRSKDGTLNNTNGSSDVATGNLATGRSKRHRLSGRYASHESASQAESRKNLDEFAPRLAKKIQEITLKHSLPFLRSRGFINRGNGCYINATLQALVACPPFYNLMHELGEIKGLKRPNSCTPIIDSFAEFFLNFLPPETSNRKNRTSSNQDQRMPMDELQAEPIEPRCIYNVLGEIKSECLKGAQEDAEEFLSSVLNGLHEEMVDLSEIAQSNSQGGLSDNNSAQADSSDETNADDWREVGPRNRSLPIRSAKVINTPIQDIFGGSLFSLRTAGKDRCGHRQPFFALQLDISSDNVKSVQDAIKSFTTPETIHDFYCSKTKQKLDASCRTSLDQLPPILILHLKQFVYTQDQGLRKLVKKIDYPIDFLLPDNCLHDKQNYFDRNHTSKSYKLLAVVYHDGNEAIKGHYLTDVYHIGSSQWIRCDDSTLKSRDKNFTSSMEHFMGLLDSCGDVFLTANGTIESHLEEFVDMVKRTDSFLDLRCLYCEILKRTKSSILERFLDPNLGGWIIISKWFEEAKQENDVDSLIELLELLTKVPMTYSTISTKNVSTPRWVKSLSKHENENISKLALPLFERWQALVNENGSHSSKKKSKKLKIAPTILLTDIKRPRNRKSLSWQCDKDLTQVHYFDFYEDERCNVTRPDYDAINGTINNGVPTSPTTQDAANGGVSTRNERRDSFGSRSSNALKRTLSHDGWPRGSKDGDNTTWKSLIPIDFAFQVLEPGWNSQEKGFEADRELGVLRALDLPGTPQTLSEPDIQDKGTLLAANNDLVKIIPLEPISPEANHLRDWSHLEWPRPSYGNNANSLLQQQHLQMQQQHALMVQQQHLLQQQQHQQQQHQQQQQLHQQQQQQLLQHQQQLLFLDQQQQQHQLFNQSSSSSPLTAFLPPSSKIARFYQPAISTHQMPNTIRSMYPQGSQNVQWVQTNRDLMNLFTVQQHQSHHLQQRPHQ